MSERCDCRPSEEACDYHKNGGPFQWQPIETAPREETMRGLIVAAPDHVAIVASNGKSLWLRYSGKYFGESIYWEPTHWMPLPPLPEPPNAD